MISDMTTKTDINIGANTANVGVFQTCVSEAFVFFSDLCS